MTSQTVRTKGIFCMIASDFPAACCLGMLAPCSFAFELVRQYNAPLASSDCCGCFFRLLSACLCFFARSFLPAIRTAWTPRTAEGQQRQQRCRGDGGACAPPLWLVPEWQQLAGHTAQHCPLLSSQSLLSSLWACCCPRGPCCPACGRAMVARIHKRPAAHGLGITWHKGRGSWVKSAC